MSRFKKSLSILFRRLDAIKKDSGLLYGTTVIAAVLVPDNPGLLFYSVGMQGIEPCLTAPKAVVLPVYDIPFSAHIRYLILHK